MSEQPTLLDDRVADVDIADRMEQAFLDYSMSVIVGRALPDVRDGLKPVQRRILYAMLEAGLRPDRQHRKCAAVIGDVMKKYHPHGDASIYDALVRLAQDFVMRQPLVEGRGNFGSVDGDPAAAHRYTECRLTRAAMALLDSIGEDTVDFAPNYDGFEREPVVLPARFPNLLVNGATGIAVGMATSIPPHNLGEVVAACLHLLEHPDATLEELMEHVPAPDFPTGGRIVPGDGIRQAYETGRGAITIEAVAATEMRSGNLPRIVVTEIPYQVNKATLLERIAEGAKQRRFEAIRDLRDESSRDGMRIVIELKRGEDPAATLAQLYDSTELRTNFNTNLVALDRGQPRTMGLRDVLLAYLEHQRTVLTRRTTHRRDKAAARAHVLEGLMAALRHLDAVIALIRAAPSAEVARQRLLERFDLTDVQAAAVLDMQLRRLAALERDAVTAEHAELRDRIAELQAILDDAGRLDGLLAAELVALADDLAEPRRSRLGDTAPAATRARGDAPPVVLEAQPVTVYVTAGGWVKAVGERPTSAAHPDDGDRLAAVLRGRAGDTVLLVDAAGIGYRVELADLEVTTLRRRGTHVAALTGETPGAPLVGAVRLHDHATVATVSARGLVKRSAVDDYLGRTRSLIAAGTKHEDRILAVVGCDDGDELLLAHSQGLVIRFPAADVRVMGRTAAGVTGIDVPPGAEMVAASVAREEVVTIASDGAAKRVPLEDHPLQRRGGKGVQTGTGAPVWVGSAAALHVPTVEGWQVVAVESLTRAKRAQRPSAALPAVTGTVVAETVPAGR